MYVRVKCVKKMANKTVLLSYLDRNKKVIIIKESESVQSESDFQYLRRKVLELFNFKTEGNVKLDIIFQEFDEEFGEFIDIEQQEECDDLIKDKQKLKVVVTPSLTTPTQSVSVTEVSLIMKGLLAILLKNYLGHTNLKLDF